MRITAWLVLLLLCSNEVQALHTTDSVKKHSTWFFSWGYTRAWYAKSTLHLTDLSSRYHTVSNTNHYYDLYFEKVTATDRPDFDKIRDVVNLTIPQFVFRLGCRLNAKWDFEFNYDHTKYIVNDYQSVRMHGQWFHKSIDTLIVLDPKKLLHFEHSDGANFALFNAVRKIPILKNIKTGTAEWVIKTGVGFVYPRTDITLFGERLNNKWHVAGVIAGLESGLRYDFFKRWRMECCAKTSYANYSSCLVVGAGSGTARHKLLSAQVIATLGYCF